MKLIALMFVFIFAADSLADMEHREGFGTKPSAERLSRARDCWHEIQKLGCVHPREDQEKFNVCLKTNSGLLSADCGEFFNKLYGKRKKDKS